MNLEKKIKKIRLDKKITQKELAKQLNVDISTICLWENGKRKPSFKSIKKMISCNILEKKDLLKIK